MQFLYVKSCGERTLAIDGEPFAHLCQSRRAKVGSTQALRNLHDDTLYTYRIESISRKNATLLLESSQILPNTPQHFSHLIWAMTTPQTIYKALPHLNELGLGKLSLYFGRFSQGGARLDEGRIERILIESCQQCGRSSLCQIEMLDDFHSALECYPRASVLDFGGEVLQTRAQAINALKEGVFIGAEGGFSKQEREAFVAQNRKIYGVDSTLILRSQSAAMAILAKGI